MGVQHTSEEINKGLVKTWLPLHHNMKYNILNLIGHHPVEIRTNKRTGVLRLGYYGRTTYLPLSEVAEGLRKAITKERKRFEQKKAYLEMFLDILGDIDGD